MFDDLLPPQFLSYGVYLYPVENLDPPESLQTWYGMCVNHKLHHIKQDNLSRVMASYLKSAKSLLSPSIWCYSRGPQLDCKVVHDSPFLLAGNPRAERGYLCCPLARHISEVSEQCLGLSNNILKTVTMVLSNYLV